jgi:hypothetical protein
MPVSAHAGASATGNKPKQKRPSASLTIAHTASLVSLPVGAFTLRVMAKGLPPTGDTKLRNDNGTNVTTVSATGASCGGPTHYTGVGHRIWCLRIRNLHPGSQVSGTLKGGTKLKLTASGRIGWGLPILVALASVLVGVLLAVFSIKVIPGLLNQAPGVTERTVSLEGLDGVVLAVAGALSVIAILTTFSTVYASNSTFGTSSDWLSLIASALGTSSASTIAGVLVSLRFR